jgi:hypothetical protein
LRDSDWHLKLLTTKLLFLFSKTRVFISR